MALRAEPSEGRLKWQWIWKLNVRPKIKNFILKFCHSGIPVKERLQSKGVRTDPVCFLCGAKEETINHLFAECDWVKKVWFLSPLGKHPQLQSNRRFSDLLMERAVKEPRIVSELISYVI